MTQNLVFTVLSHDGERVDEITFRGEDGPTLVDSSAVKKNASLVALSSVLGVRLQDVEEEGFDPAAFMRGLPSARRGLLVRYVLEATRQGAR